MKYAAMSNTTKWESTALLFMLKTPKLKPLFT